MHPWLAGAQYHTCPSLSMHSVVHSREKERGNVGGVRRREKELGTDKLRACVRIRGRRCSAIGALFAKYLPGYHEYNAVPQKFVHATVERGANKRFERPWTIPYISRGRFMEIRPSDPLDTTIGGLDTIEIAAPVPYVFATFLDSHAGAMNDGEARGSLAVPPLNMEESQERSR
ncbi:hypothetical protein ALC56_09269 [Trachymyrmex septentrionalis]|uniref:Uncharacterized protein n=1 Tax=Trachymyrmex septentrionalis TaxID=34720 RepID=A0A195F8C1_9HYME|nr:hypothetical protein ALC56_09269 [Trachymyrmex septentrionalis]